MNMMHLNRLLMAGLLIANCSFASAQDVFETSSTTRGYNFIDIRQGVKNTADKVLWLTVQYDLRDNFSLIGEFISAQDEDEIVLADDLFDAKLDSLGFTIGASYRNVLFNLDSTDWLVWLLYGQSSQTFVFDRGRQYPTLEIEQKGSVVELLLGLRHSFHPRVELDAGYRLLFAEGFDFNTLEGTGKVERGESLEAQLVLQATDRIGVSVVGRGLDNANPIYGAGVRFSW